jgi:4-hydroxybenzoate polyprenyltransferase
VKEALLLGAALGTFLMRSAGCAVNDVADRDFDKHVKRTEQRPVTSGAIGVKEALLLGAALALAAFCLVLTTNAATIAWSFAALAVSIFYPFTKRFFSMPQAVLGVAFSFGIPMAFSAVLGGSEWRLSAVAESTCSSRSKFLPEQGAPPQFGGASFFSAWLKII